MNNAGAFTLVELLVVLAIIVILIAVGIPNILASQKRAYDDASASCANALIKAVQIYRVDHPLTSDVPGVSDFYGTDEKDEFYGTNVCSQMSAGSIITGNAAPDGKYQFTVKHAQGRNTYLISPSGIQSQR